MFWYKQRACDNTLLRTQLQSHIPSLHNFIIYSFCPASVSEDVQIVTHQDTLEIQPVLKGFANAQYKIKISPIKTYSTHASINKSGNMNMHLLIVEPSWIMKKEV
jgi:hypothetical protein